MQSRARVRIFFGDITHRDGRINAGPETTAAAKAAAGAANLAAGSSVSLIEKDARLCLSLQQEIRSVHRVLLQVPSPARRARRHGGAPAAAAATAAATPSHRATLDLYAGNGIAKAQSTAGSVVCAASSTTT